MNVVAHGLWAAAVSKPWPKLNWKKSVFWSVFPDLVWGIPLVGYLILFRQPIPHEFSEAPWWFYHLYGVGHSLVTAVGVVAIWWLVHRRVFYEMLFWPLGHVLVDIPGHTHFRTPFLYPFSKYSLPGLFSWTWEPYRGLSFVIPIGLLILFTLRQKMSKIR